MADKTVLIGAHVWLQGDYYSSIARKHLYVPTLVSNVAAMIKELGENLYDKILMDLNLGKPNSDDLTPALTIRRIAGQAGISSKFMGISGNSRIVQFAIESGIPAIDKNDFKGLEKFLSS